MADYTTGQNTGSGGWIIGAIVIGLILLFLVFASGTPPPAGEGDGATTVEPTSLTPPAPVVSE